MKQRKKAISAYISQEDEKILERLIKEHSSATHVPTKSEIIKYLIRRQNGDK
jgi:hypothetical protein